ncbi:hypothetical protein [Endozoicomonas ascidiicola]|uniref:hypothetical protein n=1 Tax=Endozoicomonas ascidiicola TaxID=1698521 RepID=UPI00082B201E|nr:hypothetical protein [Endozoicomonas ascidiicola]
MTLKEIFDTVEKHLLKQNEQALQPDEMGFDNNCKYQTESGLKCAVGCLIKAEHYNFHLEGVTINEVKALIQANEDQEEPEKSGEMEAATALHTALRKSGVPMDKETMDMLLALQDIHDKSEPHLWRSELKFLAHALFPKN